MIDKIKHKISGCLFLTFVVFVTVFIPGAFVTAQAMQFYIEDDNEIVMPDIYIHDQSIHSFNDYGYLRNPQDLFIGSDGSIYVADTGNKRILKLTPDCVPVAEYLADEAGGMGSPEGIFVSEIGEMYIADSVKESIIHLDADGKLLGEYSRPDTPLLSKDFRFQPKKISVSSVGFLYVLCKAETQGLIAIQQDGDFEGIVAVEKVPFRIADVLIRLFGTENQKKIAAKRLPSAVSNFILSEDIIYAVSGKSVDQQIAVYNSIGKNLYPEGDYSYGGSLEDLTLLQGDIIAALDREKRLIRLFDQDGVNLGNFGGMGTRKGEFMQPAAISSQRNGTILVLDSGTAGIQSFKPTSFMEMIVSATFLTHNGDYDKASEVWGKVLEADETFSLAHNGIAQGYLKADDWKSAAEQYLYLGDRAMYSRAYSQILHDFYRKYFAVIIISITALLAFVYFIVKRTKPIALEIAEKDKPNIKLCLGILFSPGMTFENIKRNRNELKIRTILVLLGALVIVRLITVLFTHFPLAVSTLGDSVLLYEISILIIPVVSWIVASYAITSIQDGEMRFIENTYAVLLSLTPFMLISPLLTALSYMFDINNISGFRSLQIIMWAWVAGLLIFGFKQLNGYSIRKTVRTAFLSIITIGIIWFLIFVFYTMTIQVMDFVQKVIYEIRMS